MAGKASFCRQSDLSKVLKAYRDAGFEAPTLIIEPQRITARPSGPGVQNDRTGWEDLE